MAFLFEYPGLPEPPRRPSESGTPFPRWERRMAEAERLLAWSAVDEGSRDDDGKRQARP